MREKYAQLLKGADWCAERLPIESAAKTYVDSLSASLREVIEEFEATMGESFHQSKLIARARDLGFEAKRNYMGPGCEVGWPDVEIFAPRGRMVLIEFKVPGEEMRKIQVYRAQRLRRMGHEVVTCHSYDEALKVLDDLVSA